MANEILRFVDFWKNHGDKKSDTQKFGFDLLRNVLNRVLLILKSV